MPKMRVTGIAMHFGTPHKKTVIFSFADWRLVHWRIKAGPARPRIKFCLRVKQRRTATNTMVNTSFVPIIERAGKCRFGAMFTGHMKLFFGKNLPPFIVTLDDFFHSFSLCFSLSIM